MRLTAVLFSYLPVDFRMWWGRRRWKGFAFSPPSDFNGPKPQAQVDMWAPCILALAVSDVWYTTTYVAADGEGRRATPLVSQTFVVATVTKIP